MSTPKKPRSDSALKTLPPDRQETIADYARNHSLQETVAWLKADGCRTSKSSLSDFLSWYALQQQLRKNELTVETLLAEYQSANPEAQPEQIQQVGQAFFTALALQQQDVKSWFTSQQLAFKREQLALEARKVALLERKAAAFDQVKQAVNSGGITPETLTKIERELKLL